MYKTLLRPLFFLFDPEKIHHFTQMLVKFLFKIPGVSWISRQIWRVDDPKLKKEVFGLTFPNPVGLAAGFDKDARWVDELADMGFGFIEIGTLTPKPQPGNPKPRLFRLPEDMGLINRMGFNNEGVEMAVRRLKKRKRKVIVGGNIGKNKTTPNDMAISDYLTCYRSLYPVVDYFVINVSSPNTPGLRELQEKEPLKQLLWSIREENSNMPSPKPVLLKIAPDLNNEQLDDIVDIVNEVKIDGIIATNTTIARNGLVTDSVEIEKIGMGGLSGKPVKDRSTAVIGYIHEKSQGSIPVIAVGGIFSGQDALEKLEAGASLVQVYTGFIYEGPAIIKKINTFLLANKC
ncbi:MAG: quinone-dependent dihydroorotate dehydrogenase [Cytophagales bacterium]|nr:quinone-dependent dihydroorotate dehydrogenase [Cytophagales bacterium]